MEEKRKKIKVVLIEDNPGDARLLEEYILSAKDDGYTDREFEIRWFNLLSTGQRYLEQELFDVVILDLHLPDCQGMECIDGVRATVPHLPLVVLSGLMDEQNASEAIERGAHAFVVKNDCNGKILVDAMMQSMGK